MGNFGVHQPPSGMESVARSRQMSTDFMVFSNPSLGLGNPLSLKPQNQQIDPNQGSITRSNQLGLDSVLELNNPSRRFDEMIREGWGGNISVSLPTFSSGSIPIPSFPSPTPSLPQGNLNAGQIDRAVKSCSNTDFCVTLHNLGITQLICYRGILGWKSNSTASWNTSFIYSTLAAWHDAFWTNDLGEWDDYFTVDVQTRQTCFMPVALNTSSLPLWEFTPADIDNAMSEW